MSTNRWLILALLLAACTGARESPPAAGKALSPPPARSRTLPPPVHPAATTFVAGRSVEDREIPCIVLGRGEDTVLLLASVHGNEGLGTILLERLEAHLRSQPQLLAGRRVVLLPRVNPDGLARGTRENARGVDLNRNFPAANFRPGRHGARPLCESEAETVHRLVLAYGPRRVVTLHQPLAVVDYDGPAEGLARAISRACGLPVRRLGARPGSLGSFVGEVLSVPIVTLELPRAAGLVDEEALWERFGPALLVAVAFSPPPR